MHPFFVWFAAAALAGALSAQPPDLVAKSQRGKQLMAAGKFAEAAEVYQEIVRTVPDNAGMLVNLGMARYMARQPEKAIPALEAALKLQPGILPALLFLGASYLQTGAPAKAIEPLSRVVRARPEMVQARQMLGDALAAVERLEEAAEQYREWARLDPENPQAWYALGLTYETLSQQVFAELERTAPESAEMLALVAEVRVTQKQYRSAHFLYREALKRRPDMRGLYAGLAEVYRATGHPDWAKTAMEREEGIPAPDCARHAAECAFAKGDDLAVLRLTAGKKTPEALYWRARAFSRLAAEAFVRLNKLPPSLEWHELMARVHRNQGRHLEAVKEWRNALKLAPGDPALERELAISLHQSRNFKQAQALFAKLLEKEPDSSEYNFYLGDCLLNLQRVEEAIPYLEKSVRLDPKFLAARSSLARAYLAVDRGADAVPHLKAALPIDTDGSLHYQLARALREAGDMAAAREMTRKYQQIRRSRENERKELEKAAEIRAP